MTEPITVDIWSDIACPWCYIGKRRFEAGRAAFAEDPSAPEVTVRYHSFELAPDTPVDFDGSEEDFLVAHKQLPADRVKQMLAQVTDIAATVGLTYDYDRLQHTNTVKAHELLHFAADKGRQLEMLERLMSAYFTEGRHVGRIDDLAELAAEAGLDRDEAAQALREERYLDAVRADQQQAVAYGINGVPFFVIDGAYGVSGAQEAATFADVLRQVAENREASSVDA
jgi:predicted DsbA family dithiol-disulfide isomerase